MQHIYDGVYVCTPFNVARASRTQIIDSFAHRLAARSHARARALRIIMQHTDLGATTVCLSATFTCKLVHVVYVICVVVVVIDDIY